MIKSSTSCNNKTASKIEFSSHRSPSISASIIKLSKVELSPAPTESLLPLIPTSSVKTKKKYSFGTLTKTLKIQNAVMNRVTFDKQQSSSDQLIEKIQSDMQRMEAVESIKLK